MNTSRNGPCRCGSGVKYKKCCGRAKPPAIAVATPTRSGLSRETAYALRYHFDGLPKRTYRVVGKPVVEARNELCEQILRDRESGALDADHEWFVLWVDDDAWWPRGAVKDILDLAIKHADIDLIAGLYSARVANLGPILEFNELLRDSDYRACAHGCDLLRIISCGGHFRIHRLSLLDKLGPKPFSIEKDGQYEDHIFCARIRAIGGELAVAQRVKVAHVDTDTGLAYLPFEPVQRITKGKIAPAEDAPASGIFPVPVPRVYGRDIETAVTREFQTAEAIRLHLEKLRRFVVLYEGIFGKPPPLADMIRDVVGPRAIEKFRKSAMQKERRVERLRG